MMDCRVKPGNDEGKFVGIPFPIERISRPVRPRAGRSGFFFFSSLFLTPPPRANEERRNMSKIPKRLLLGLGLAGFIMESIVVQSAFAAEKISLFKVITAKDEIVIGLSDGELAQMDGNAGGVAKALVAKGTLSVWRYAVRKAASGDLEQAPLHKVGLIAADSLRVEPYATPLKVMPMEGAK
jgi:hypothetical protein